jgi:hypothetical protein
MQKLIEVVQDWPVLVQGVLASALFYFLLLAAQRLWALIAKAASYYSATRRKSALISESLRLEGSLLSPVEGGGAYAAVLTMRALRRIITGLLWMALGLMFGSFLPVLGVVGYLGCIYHLLAAAQVVRYVPTDFDVKERLRVVDRELGLSEGDDRGLA